MWQSFTNSLNNLGGELGEFLPSLLGALLLLVVGWLVALLISKGVEKLLQKTSIDNKLHSWVSGDDAAAYRSDGKLESTIGTIVFYALMIFVVIGFFQVLGVSAVTDPLNGMLESVLVFLPRIAGAALLALIAWAVATGLRIVVTKALTASGVDSKIAEHTDGDAAATRRPLSSTLGEVVYWVVWLMFLPAILGTLRLVGLLGPVEGLVDEIVGFLPNIVLAAVILILGWFVAKIIQRIVTNLLSAAGFDRLSQKAGIDNALGSKTASEVVGIVLYTLILLPVIIAALQALDANAITEPASAMLYSILNALPAIFGAALILVISYIIGRVVAELVANLLESLGINRIPGMLGLEKLQDGGMKLSEVARWIIMVSIVLFASLEAAEMLGFGDFSGIIEDFIFFAGQILLGLIIFGLGIWLAQVAERAVRATARGNDEFIAQGAKVAIIVMAGAMALRQMGLANEIVVLAFGLTFGALAVAFAVAFGIGGREVAGDELREWVKERKKKKAEPNPAAAATSARPTPGTSSGAGRADTATSSSRDRLGKRDGESGNS